MNTFYLGRVTATAQNYLTLEAKHGPAAPPTRAAGRAYAAAVRAAMDKGADLGQLAAATGISFEMRPPVTPEAMRVQAELAEVQEALSHLDGVRALTRDTTTGYVREQAAS